MRTWRKILLCGAVLVLAGLLWLWSQDSFGVSLGDLEAEARRSQRVPEDWLCAADAGEETAGLLFYPQEGGRDEFIFSVYAKNGGLSFGYFFRAGGSLGTIADGVAGYQEDGERVYLSMNRAGICWASAGSGDSVPLEPGEPFVLVRGESVEFFDKDREPVPCVWM